MRAAGEVSTASRQVHRATFFLHTLARLRQLTVCCTGFLGVGGQKSSPHFVFNLWPAKAWPGTNVRG